MKRISVIFIMLLTVVSADAFAQMVPVNKRFGKVSKEEVELKEYAADTSASALMLYEETYMSLNFDAGGGFVLNTKKHQRIKILKEEGLHWGDVEMIYYFAPVLRENIYKIDVVTYNIVDGKVVETKMPNKYIFDEEFTENYRKMSFSAQEVRVGSVIEIRYEITSNRYWDVSDIYIQKSIPVNLSECTVRLPSMFDFNKTQQGYVPVEYESIPESASLLLGGGSTYSYTVITDKFKAIDVPAFKIEPYLYNANQYYTAILYDIKSLNIPGTIHENYSVTWEDVDNNFIDSELMRRFKGQCQFKDETASLALEGTDVDKIASVVKMVKDKVQWNEKYKLIPEPLPQVVKAQSGSNADINCLIAGCLRELGYVVEPVLIKLRSSGYLLEIHPELRPYDTMILKVDAKDGRSYFLDGGPGSGYPNVLSPLMLIDMARILRPEGRSEWVNLTRLGHNGTTIFVKAQVTPELSLSGTYNAKFTGQDSYDIKNLYASFDDEDGFIEDIEGDNLIEVIEFNASGMRDYSPSASYDYAFEDEIIGTDGKIYINPFVTRFHSKDSFQSITREYPIDFPYPYTVTYMYNLVIPDGYTVEQLPENSLIKFAGLDATVRFMTSVQGSEIAVMFNYTQKRMVGQSGDYAQIREFWQYMNALYESMIVLKKN